ncbi:MAG: hypothetical protein ABFR33_05915 [Verrucomicrobiota bacterium]
MRTSSIERLACLLVILAGHSVYAEVVPVNILLYDDNSSYSIPAGKTLIIEHFIWALEADSTHQNVSIKPANHPVGMGSFLLKFSVTAPDSWTPSRPIKIVGGSGATISILSGAADWRDVMIVGMLVDQADLYAAAIHNELESPQLAGGNFQFDVVLASPRPVVVQTEYTDDLTGPYLPTSTHPTKTSEAGRWHFQQSLAELDSQGFFRSRVHARETE